MLERGGELSVRRQCEAPGLNRTGLEEALARYGVPEIFNSDQDSQFTSEDWLDRLKATDRRISGAVPLIPPRNLSERLKPPLSAGKL